MEQFPHNLFADAFQYMFGRIRTSVNERGESAREFQLQPSQPIQPDREAMSLPGSPIPHPADEDVDMLPAVLPSTRATAALSHSPTPHLSQSPSLPPSGSLATSSSHSLVVDSDLSHLPHPFVVDDDVRSDTSMPSLFDASDSESGEELFHRNVYDFMSESEADAHDVEMTLLIDDDGDYSDSDDALPSDAVTTAEGSVNHHVMVEEDQNLPHTVPSSGSPSGPQPGASSHVDQPHLHALPHHLHTHLHPHPHPHPPLYPQPHQHLNPPHLPQFNAGVQLPTFPGMPGLRAQGQGDGQVPLPGLRTLFQPLIVEAVAEAGERIRTAQGRGNPGHGPGPTTGPDAGANRTGVPVVQVTFNVPVFRLPADARPRQQQQTEAQRPTEQAGEHERAAPSRSDNVNGENDVNPPAPNAIPDGIPNPLRQFIEALDFNPNPNADGPQVGPSPALTGLLGLLFGLGLGSPELHREDPARAKRLVKGLEKVNAGLVRRMRKISEGSADGAICAICWDTLLEENTESTEVPIWDATSDREQATDPEPGPSSPPANPEEPLPRVVALPCSHVFHSGCLVPWFSRPKQTTCPTCRFNVDPDNLTYEPPRRPQTDHRPPPPPPPPPLRPMGSQPVAPAQPTQQQQQQESSSGPVPPPQLAPFPLPPPPPQRRTIFEHTFTIPFPPPPFPFPLPQSGNLGPQQGLSPATDPFSPQVYQRMLHTLRQFSPPTQQRPPPPLDGAPVQEGPAPPSMPQEPQVRPPVQGQRQGLQPPPQDANANGMPRFPGLFQFELPQVVHVPDHTWLWATPLGDLSPPLPFPRAPPHPPAPRAWAPPPPPGLTLRQRVEQGEREQGLRCDDVSCGIGPSDDDPEPTADLARVVIYARGDGTPACTHAFHPACLVSAERVAGWAPEDVREQRTGGPVEVSCPVCRAVGAVPREDWKMGVQALA